MPYEKLHYVPVTVSLVIPLAIIITYAWAVYMDHVSPIFPYISDTSSLPPESCVFSQLFSLASVLLTICVYVRYRQISELVSDKTFSKRNNLLTAWIGIAGTVGFNMIGNFQEYNILSVHLLATIICVSCATIYVCVQSRISYKMSPRIHKSWVLHLRTTLSVICVICSITSVISGVVSIISFSGSNTFKWASDDKGYTAHLVSTVSEWLVVFCLCAYFFTYMNDFSIIKIYSPRVEIDLPIISKT